MLFGYADPTKLDRPLYHPIHANLFLILIHNHTLQILNIMLIVADHVQPHRLGYSHVMQRKVGTFRVDEFPLVGEGLGALFCSHTGL